jgi:type I restriction enzyme S subunit
VKWRAYPKYKVSGIEWLGEIPEHWDRRRLKFIADVRPSGVDKKRSEHEVPVRFLGTNTVYNSDEIRNRIELESATATPSEIARFLLRKGDIVLTKDSVVPTRIADVAVVMEPLDNVICGYHLILIRLRETADKVSAWRFLFYYLGCSSINHHFLSEASGTTIIGIGSDTTSGVSVLCPPLPEQHTIAAFLDRETARIDALIEKKERQIELLGEKRAALISHAVTMGLDPDAPMKDSGVEWLGEVPAHWEVMRLKYLIKGTLANGLFKKKRHFGSGVKLVNVFDVYRDNFLVDFESLDRVEADKSEQRKYAVYDGDIFFVRSSLKLEGVGRSVCAFDIPEPTVFECHIVRARPNQVLVNPKFLINFLNSVYATNRLVALSNMVTMATIDQDKVKSMEVPVPSLAEQNEIMNYLEHEVRVLDTLTQSVQESIAKLREYRTALISAAVTGKIDVR